MKEVRYVVVLTVIAAVSAALLSAVNMVTTGPIEAARQRKVVEGIKAVLPGFDNDPVTGKLVVDPDDALSPVVFPGFTGDKLIGAAVQVVDRNGYGGNITFMIGVVGDPESELKINGYKVLAHKETPGLGTKITSDEFRTKFLQTFDPSHECKVKKDGGQVHAISGATISSRAITNAANLAVKTFREQARNLKPVTASDKLAPQSAGGGNG